MMSLTRVVSLVIFLAFFDFGWCCKKVYFIPGSGEFNWYAQLIIDKLHELHPCSEFEIISNNLIQRTSWDLVYYFKPKFDEITKLNPNGMHLMGFSQGGHIARALVEITPNHTVETLVTMSTPHNGCFGIPGIGYLFPSFNSFTAMEFFTKIIYHPLFQEFVPMGVLWKDPIRYSEYQKKNRFLTFLNNEVPHFKAKSFKQAMLKLKKFVMITGISDAFVIPYQSNIFGFFDKNMNAVNMTELDMYKNDVLGLKTLNEDGRIITCERPHLGHTSAHDDVETAKDCILPYLT